MILKQFKKTRISKGVAIYCIAEIDKTIKSEGEIWFLLKSDEISTRDFLNNKFISSEIAELLSGEFIIDSKKYNGFLAINMKYIADAVDYLWENAMTSKGFESVLQNYQKGKRIKKIISKMNFYNKLISELLKDYPNSRRIIHDQKVKPIILYKGKFDLHELIKDVIRSHSRRRRGRRNYFTCLAKRRFKENFIIYDYIFASGDLNEQYNQLAKHNLRKNKLITIYDGRIVKLNDEIIQEFSREGFIRTISLTDEDIRSLMVKTVYVIRNDCTDRKEDFQENVYYAARDPQIIFYNDLKILGKKNNDINLISRIDDFIYHPQNNSKQTSNNFNFLALGVIDDFFSKV